MLNSECPIFPDKRIWYLSHRRKDLTNAHIYASSEARGLNVDVSLHLFYYSFLSIQYLTRITQLAIQRVIEFLLSGPQKHKQNASKKGDKDQESIQSSTTLDPGYRMGK